VRRGAGRTPRGQTSVPERPLSSIVGGVFTVIWHNTSLLRPFSRHYRMILDILGGASDYDWQSDLAQLRLLSRTLPCYNFSSTTNRARPAMSQPTSVSVT